MEREYPKENVRSVLSFAMTFLGSVLPALRAARLDPAIVMRAE